jgi:hypothetical protein
VHEVPGTERSLFAFDEQDALAGEHEEVLLRILAVVHGARLAGSQDADADADLVEPRVLRLEGCVEAAAVGLEPGHLAGVEDEPPRPGGADAVRYALERSLGGHRLRV